jgi:hypothetical protein
LYTIKSLNGNVSFRAGRSIDAPGPGPEMLRPLRAVEVLERINTAEARRLLERLSKGQPEALLTVDAAASLQRLTRRPPAAP